MPLPPATTSLPPSFTSLFRLFLRATSTSVLHHGPALKHLRALWRPTFVDGAQAAHAIMRAEPASAESARLSKWYKTFVQRVEETLSVLTNSTKTRGLAHSLTKNLSLLRREHLIWFRDHHYSFSGQWNPSLPPGSTEYQPRDSERRPAQKERKARVRVFQQQAWGALSEVVRMAEGRDGVVLGRMVPVVRKPGDIFIRKTKSRKS